MQSRNQPVRKTKDKHGPELKTVLSLRSAFLLTVAVLAGLGSSGLLYAAHRPAALIALGAIGISGGALKLLNSLIELVPRYLIRFEELQGSYSRAVLQQLREHGGIGSRGDLAGPLCGRPGEPAG